MAEPSNPKKPSDSDKKAADKASEKTADKKPEAAATPSKPADAKAADKAPTKGADPKASDKPSDKTSDKTSASPSAGKTSSVPGAGASKPAAASPAKSSSSGGRSLVTIIVVIALAGAGAYVTRDVWLPSVEPYLAKIPGYQPTTSVAGDAAPQSPVADLSARLGALESKLADAGGSGGDAQQLKSDLDQALARIDDLERRLAEVREMATAVTSSGGASVDLSPMMARIDELEATDRAAQQDLSALADKIDNVAKDSSGSGKASGLVLAIAQLRDTALSGRPFGTQLEAISALAADQPEVRAATIGLADRADTGLPTMDVLKSRFGDIAGDIVTLARSGDGDWVEQAAGRLSQLVALRRTDGQSGDPVEDAVAGIERSMAAGDIASAVTTASTLSDSLDGEAQKILENWLIDAKARASAVRALDALNATALAGLGG